MLKPNKSPENGKAAKHLIPIVLFLVLFLVSAWCGEHYEVVMRGEGLLSTFAPTSLLIGCAMFSVFYGAFCLWMAKLSQKPSEFLQTFFVSVFVMGPFFIYLATITFSSLALSLNRWFDTSEPQAYRTVIQQILLFDGGIARGGKHSFYYRVYAVDWHDSKTRVRLNINPNNIIQGPDIAVQAPLGFFSNDQLNITKGSKIIVTTRRGFLGYEWIESIRQ